MFKLFNSLLKISGQIFGKTIILAIKDETERIGMQRLPLNKL